MKKETKEKKKKKGWKAYEVCICVQYPTLTIYPPVFLILKKVVFFFLGTIFLEKVETTWQIRKS